MSVKVCDACGASVAVNAKRDFGRHVCPRAQTDATSPDHKPCPEHGGLVWIVGPYSTYRICGGARGQCHAGRNGKPWRYCAPRGESRTDDRDDDSTELPPVAPANPTPNATHREALPMVTNHAPNGAPNAALEAFNTFAALVAQQASPVIDEGKVRSIVSEIVEAKLQTTVSIQLVITQPDKGLTATIEHPHPYLARVIRLVEAGLPVYLWGPAGGGKTTAGMQAAKAIGRDSEIDTLDPSTFRSMVQGYCTPTGEPVHTSFTRCWEGGKLYIADEADNAPGHVQTLFNSALANGHAPLAWGNAARGEGFGFVATGNTSGRPTREFPDRKPMSAAFADRLYFVHWPLDERSERAWSGVGGKAREIELPEPREISADSWVNWVQAIREWARTNAPTLMVTPRASLTGLRALALGETPEQVADALVFRGADAELRGKALAAVRLP